MEVVVYDENINNINTYFNDYIIDHNQDISFRVYNKKLDVLYKDIAHNKIRFSKLISVGFSFKL